VSPEVAASLQHTFASGLLIFYGNSVGNRHFVVDIGDL